MSPRIMMLCPAAWLALLAGCGSSGESATAVANDPQVATSLPSMMHMDQIGMENGRGLFVARRDAGDTRIAFDVPAGRLAPERRHDMEQVGEAGGTVVVLDRYASLPAPGGRCADGRETFVRVLSLTARREIFARPVESCLTDMAATPVEWLGDGRFRIGQATFAIRGDDRVTAEDARG